MKVAILAGGLGTRLTEETAVKPKPMVNIGDRPILWHIMKIYSTFGFNEFVVALGYRGGVIKDYFMNYYYRDQQLTINLAKGEVIPIGNKIQEPWKIHLIDTGLETQTGGRVKRLLEFIGNETFMLTYGDGVADVNVGELLKLHKKHGKLATVTAVRPPARFGGMTFENSMVTDFIEKPQIGEGWINGGFFVLEPGIIKYLNNDQTIFEKDPLERLAKEGQLVAYQHDGFWQCMDTLREVKILENLWDAGVAPWKTW